MIKPNRNQFHLPGRELETSPEQGWVPWAGLGKVAVGR